MEADDQVEEADQEVIVIERMLSLLQEKRTDLKTIRVGIALFLAQLSILGFLAVRLKSRLTALPVPHAAVLLALANAVVFLAALGLIIRPLVRLRRVNSEITRSKSSLCALGLCDL
jgi:hypothetical protein